MTVVTIKSNERIMNVWRESVKRVLPNARILEVDSEPKDVLELFQILESCKDDVLYTLPVHVIHNVDFLASLQTMDFIGFKQSGRSCMALSFFAATNKGVSAIIKFGDKRFDYDNNIDVESNVSNLVLNSLGDKVEMRTDNNTLVHTITINANQHGMIATMCGSNDIMEVLAQSRLNAFDVIPQLMETSMNDTKAVEYREN